MRLESVCDILQAGGEAFEILTAGDAKLIITRRGGRVLGPFTPHCLTWLNGRAFKDAQGFADFVRSGHWNMGGDRVWIAPEIRFAVGDRTRFWETLQTPAVMDPAQYRLGKQGEAVHLQAEMELPVYPAPTDTKRLGLARLIRPAAHPLRQVDGYDALCGGLGYCGYEQRVTLRQGDDKPYAAEAWNLTQVPPGGVVMIPAFGGEALCQPVNYYRDVGPLQHITSQGVYLKVTGQDQYKVGYKAAGMTGRMAYLRRMDAQNTHLLVRSFFNDPSAEYAEEPPLLPGCRGYSVHVYNDDGANGPAGGFGEMEVNGRPVGGPGGEAEGHDVFTTWHFWGAHDRLCTLAELFCGMAVEPL